MDTGDLAFWFNVIEALFWGLIGIVVLAKSRAGRRRERGLGWWAGVTFWWFGFSDVIEARTGAWWEPWWLFLLKAACVASLLACLATYARGKKAEKKPVGTPE